MASTNSRRAIQYSPDTNCHVACPLLPLPGPSEMSALSPRNAPKWTLIRFLSPFAILSARGSNPNMKWRTSQLYVDQFQAPWRLRIVSDRLPLAARSYGDGEVRKGSRGLRCVSQANQSGSVSLCSKARNFASLVCRAFTCLRNSLMIADTRDRPDISVQP